MHSHTWIVLAFAVACGNKSDGIGSSPTTVGSGSARPAGSGSAIAPTSGSGSAAAPASGACFESDSSNRLSHFVVGAAGVTVCIAKSDLDKPDAPPAEKCMALDYASGTYKVVAKPEAAKPEAHAASFKDAAGKFEMCMPGACVKLELPKAKAGEHGGDPEKWMLAAREDGAVVAATGGGTGKLTILDGKTGKRKKTLKVSADYPCIEAPSFLGDTIYVPSNVCAGPGGGGFLFDSTGKALGKVQNVNVYGSAPVHLGATTYAFRDFGATKVSIVDVKTGKEAKTIETPDPENCETCQVLGDASTWTASGIAKRPDGKLVIIGGQIVIVDPAADKAEKVFQLPGCKK